MIETFQKIVGILTKSSKDSTKKHMRDIEKDFSDFYDNMDMKLHSIDCILKDNPTDENHKLAASGSHFMGRSHFNKTEVSDNLMYSPSNMFDESLMASRFKNSINPSRAEPHLLGKKSHTDTQLHDILSRKNYR